MSVGSSRVAAGSSGSVISVLLPAICVELSTALVPAVATERRSKKMRGFIARACREKRRAVLAKLLPKKT